MVEPVDMTGRGGGGGGREVKKGSAPKAMDEEVGWDHPPLLHPPK